MFTEKSEKPSLVHAGLLLLNKQTCEQSAEDCGYSILSTYILLSSSFSIGTLQKIFSTMPKSVSNSIFLQNRTIIYLCIMLAFILMLIVAHQASIKENLDQFKAFESLKHHTVIVSDLKCIPYLIGSDNLCIVYDVPSQ